MSLEEDNRIPETNAAAGEADPKTGAEGPAKEPAEEPAKTGAKKKTAKKKAAKKQARKKTVRRGGKSEAQPEEPRPEQSESADGPRQMEMSAAEDRSPRESAGEVSGNTGTKSGGYLSFSPEEDAGSAAPAADSAPGGEKTEPTDASGRSGEEPRSGEQQEKRRQGRSSDGGSEQGGHRQDRRSNGPGGGDRQGDRGDRQNDRGDRGNRNNRAKNKKNRKPKGNRWQPQKKKRAPGEETPIQLGELPEFEALESFEELNRMSAELGAGVETGFDFVRAYSMALPELREEVRSAGLESASAPNREAMLNALLADAAKRKTPILTTGVLELLEEDEGGVLVYERDNYRMRSLSAYVPRLLIETHGLQRGHIVRAQLHPSRENETCPFVVRLESVMDRDPDDLREIIPFTERTPYYPLDRILLECDPDSPADNLSMRVVDCLTPVGFGQRGLIVAPPRTGKTVLLQGMAHSVQTNYPDAHLIILLIDERPEEVTDFRRRVSGEVISSTFDEAAESHVHAAEMVIEKARRMVEVGRDVVILLDSITRLARAYNTTMPNSGKILSGGVEANALQKPKRFFGSARNIEDGGSLTIMATALVETGSKMDEVIFEEFKGTGNMELHLDRGLSDKRIYPALSMDRSGTRKEELLYHPDEMRKIYSLRRAMKGLPSNDAMEMLIQRIRKTKTNAEFLMSVSR